MSLLKNFVLVIMYMFAIYALNSYVIWIDTAEEIQHIKGPFALLGVIISIILLLGIFYIFRKQLFFWRYNINNRNNNNGDEDYNKDDKRFNSRFITINEKDEKD